MTKQEWKAGLTPQNIITIKMHKLAFICAIIMAIPIVMLFILNNFK